MVEVKQKIAKDLFIAQIMSDINEIPLIYLKTLYALVHTFKENILTIQPEENTIPMPAPKDEEDAFDWDNLLKDIHLNRQKNNLILTNRINQFLTD
jgi:hypothetical protein